MLQWDVRDHLRTQLIGKLEPVRSEVISFLYEFTKAACELVFAFSFKLTLLCYICCHRLSINVGSRLDSVLVLLIYEYNSGHLILCMLKSLVTQQL